MVCLILGNEADESGEGRMQPHFCKSLFKKYNLPLHSCYFIPDLQLYRTHLNAEYRCAPVPRPTAVT
jgi:hypothetical protein